MSTLLEFFTLLRSNALPGRTGLNGDESPPELERQASAGTLRRGTERRAGGCGEFRTFHTYGGALHGARGASLLVEMTT